MTACPHPVRRRPLCALFLGGALLAVASCASPPEARDRAIAAPVSTVFAHSPRFETFARQYVAALTRESALYSHHFEAGGSKLTDLGRRALGALIRANRSAPLEIHVSPGACSPEELGAARLAAVRALVEELKLIDGAVRVTTGHAYGRGAAARDVAARLQAFEQRPMTAPRGRSFDLSR